MGTQFKYYKRKFRNALEPMFVMLIAKKKDLDAHEWTQLVEKTVVRINENPGEFLGHDLPSDNLRRDVLDELFQQFVKEKAIR